MEDNIVNLNYAYSKKTLNFANYLLDFVVITVEVHHSSKLGFLVDTMVDYVEAKVENDYINSVLIFVFKTEIFFNNINVENFDFVII